MTSVKKVSMLCVLWLRSNDPDIWFVTTIAKKLLMSHNSDFFDSKKFRNFIISIRDPWTANSADLAVLVGPPIKKSPGPRLVRSADRLVRADKLFGPWIPDFDRLPF